MGMQLDLTDQLIDDKYRVIKEIGRGGWGVVLLVEPVNDPGVQYALKLLHADVLTDDENRKRFAREALALKMLKHPNVVHVYEFGEWRGCPYYIMEVVTGRTLLSLIQERGTLSVQETADIGMQLCSAMSQAHAAGIIHRDITPANLLVDESNRLNLKVLDFGLAKFVGLAHGNRLTKTGLTLGSCLYMSPEQCRGEQLDARSDVYAIGCVLYECITGLPPFPADNGVAAMMRHIHDDVPALASATADGAKIVAILNKIIQRALSKDRESRYQKAGDMLEDLRVIGTLDERIRRHDHHTAQIRIDRNLVHAAQLGMTQAIEASQSKMVALEKCQKLQPRSFFSWTWLWLVCGLSLVIIGGVVYTQSRHEFARSSKDEVKESKTAPVRAVPAEERKSDLIVAMRWKSGDKSRTNFSILSESPFGFSFPHEGPAIAESEADIRFYQDVRGNVWCERENATALLTGDRLPLARESADLVQVSVGKKLEITVARKDFPKPIEITFSSVGSILPPMSEPQLMSAKEWSCTALGSELGELSLHPKPGFWRVSGRVCDVSREPVNGALVNVGDVGVVRCDRQGRFTCYVPGPEYQSITCTAVCPGAFGINDRLCKQESDIVVNSVKTVSLRFVREDLVGSQLRKQVHHAILPLSFRTPVAPGIDLVAREIPGHLPYFTSSADFLAYLNKFPNRSDLLAIAPGTRFVVGEPKHTLVFVTVEAVTEPLDPYAN